MLAASSPLRTHATRTQGVVRSFSIEGPSGRLEAVLNEGAANAPFAALVCHPHPLGGGTLHNKVVYHAMKVLSAPSWGFGFPVLRFNFRGVGLSRGVHDGELEREDVRAALEWLENEYNRPQIVLGFSFGAAMALAACCSASRDLRRVRALVALGLPTQAEGRIYDYHSLSHCTIPKLFLSGDHDAYAPADQLACVVASAAAPKHLRLLPNSDHFFAGQLASMQQALADWLTQGLR